MSRNFDALKSPLQGFLGYHSRFVPPTRWITFTGVPSTLTNFPVLVKAVGWQNIANGFDVHFQDSSGNELSFDMDWYDDSSKTGAWWVQIPTLSSGTAIKALYGDASVTANQSSPSTVWADYEFVYHFNVNSTTQPAAKGSSITFTRTPKSLGLVDGVTGRALQITNKGSGSAYYGWNIAGTAGWGSLTITAIGSAGPGIECRASSGIYYNSTIGYNATGAEVKYAALPLSAGELSHVSFSCNYSSSSPLIRISANGNFQEIAANARFGSQWSLAGTIDYATYWTDEIRVKNSTVSEDWQKYEYYNSILHNDYTTYSEEV